MTSKSSPIETPLILSTFTGSRLSFVANLLPLVDRTTLSKCFVPRVFNWEMNLQLSNSAALSARLPSCHYRDMGTHNKRRRRRAASTLESGRDTHMHTHLLDNEF